MPFEPSRRTVLGAAAWSAPVIALAVATPARAASLVPTVMVMDPGTAGELEQTLNVVFTDLPVIAASGDDGPGNLFLSLCLPAGIVVTSVTSTDGVSWRQPDPADDLGGESFTYNVTEVAAGDLTVTFSLALAVSESLEGTIEVDVFLSGVLEPEPVYVPYRFGESPQYRTCSGGGNSVRQRPDGGDGGN